MVELKSGKTNLLPYIYSTLEEQIVSCESSFKINAVGDHGLAYGPAQFHKETFYRIKQDAIKKGAKLYYLDYHNPADQLLLLNWALNNGYGSEWSTYKKALKGKCP